MTPNPALMDEHSLRLRIAGGIGVTGVGLIFALGLRSPTGMYVGTLLTIIALGLAIDRAGPVLVREPVFWLAVLLFVSVFLRGWVDLATAAERGFEPDPDGVWHHARYTPLFAVVFGLWLAAFWHRRHILLAIFGLGFVIYMAQNWDRLLYTLPGGERPFGSAFGEAGLMGGTLVFLLAAAAIGFWRGTGRWRWLGLATAGGLALFAAGVFIAAQGRAVWLAMIGTLAVFAVAGAWYLYTRATPVQRRNALFAVGGSAVLAGIALALWWDVIAGRMMRDSETIAVLLQGDVEPDDVPGGSVGDRYRMYRQGIIDVANHPWWGVGPASVRDMLHEIWGKPRGGSGNYHSTWFNLPVAMGIPWALLWLGVHAWAVYRAARQLLVVDRDVVLGIAVIGAALVHFGTLTFQVRIWSTGGSALYLILMTIVIATFLRHRTR